MMRALSIELEEHLVNQVLKVEDGRFAYTDGIQPALKTLNEQISPIL